MDLRQVFDDLVRFETVLWGSIDLRLKRECGFALGTLEVLRVIGRTPACRVQEVAAALAITVGGASQAVDRLAAAAWCDRRPNPADRRSSVLRLTRQGEAAVESGGTVLDDELRRLLGDPLSAGALTHFGAALATVRQSAMNPAVTVEKPSA